ncbi:MAG: glyoxalase [Bacteroidota bacterium]
MSRKELQQLRPVIASIDEAASITPEEQFQNSILRPILKFQNPLLLQIYCHYLEQRKGQFYKLPNAKEKFAYIQHSIQKDSKLRELLMGVVIGHFTEEEYSSFLKREKAIRKRILNLMVQRIQDQMEDLR